MIVTLTKLTDRVRAAALADVDTAAETARLRYVTPGAAQMLAYQEKVAEAERYLANEAIDLVRIPHLVAEVGITGPTVYHVAQIILGLRDYWKVVSAEIERLRLTAKANISAATSLAEIDAARAIDWP